MFFENAADEMDKILSEENLLFSESFKKCLLSIMSEMCNYTEEDHKVRPQIILGNNVNNFFRTVSPHNYYVMYRDSLNGDGLPRFFKSLALFCDNGWYIVINRLDDKIEYGLFRKYADISEKKFEDYFRDSFSKDLNCNMITIKARNNFEIVVTRWKEEDFVISQRYIEISESVDSEHVYKSLTEDVIAENDPYSKEYGYKCFMKMFRNLPQQVHGTILLVVEDDFKLVNNVLSGIEIDPAIDYYESFLKYKTINSYMDAETIYSLTGLLYEMLNTDGITIITNKGRVLYYNVFYEGSIPEGIKGGARKRTAKGILGNSKLEGVIGVYFQSQDGDIFYEKKGEI